MPAENINVLIKLRGGKDFRRDADAAGRSVKGITGQSKRLGAQAAKTDRAVSRHRRGVVALGTAAKYGGAALGGGLVVGLKSSITAYEESRKVTAETNRLILNSGGVANASAKHIAALGTSIMKKTGIDDEQIKSGSNMLLTFHRIRNEVGKGSKIFDRATVAATDLGVKMGTDSAGAATQLGKALSDPAKGLTRLMRSNIDFTKSEQKKIMTLQKSGNVLGAQKLMLGVIEGQVGGVAASHATPLAKLKISLGELQETIGGGVSPIVDKAATKLNRFVTGMAAGTGPGGQFVRTLRSVWGSAKPVLTVLGRMVVGVGRFTAAHPVVAKLAVSFLALGAAVKVLRFAKKASEFSTLVRGARAAPGRIRAALASTRGIVARIMGRAGTSGGQRLASTMASTAGSGVGPSFNRQGTKFRTVGHTAGGKLGKAAGSTAGTSTINGWGGAVSRSARGGRLLSMFKGAGRVLGAAGAAIAIAEIGSKINSATDGAVQRSSPGSDPADPRGRNPIQKLTGKLFGIGRMGGQVTPGGIKRFAGGGMVPKGEDTLAGLRYGEFVQRQSAVRREGVGAMRALNEGRAKITMPDRVPVDLGGVMANRAGGGSPIHVEVKLGEKVLMDAIATHVDRKRPRR